MSSAQNCKKFRDERVVQIIDKCITLKDADMKKNNEVLKEILNEVLKAMKEHDDFFRDHFQEPVFVGSYYKGTKVGKPEEFDVNLIIKLPVKYESIVFKRDLPGFTMLKLSPDGYTPNWEIHRKIMAKWVDREGYLNQDEFRQSMEKIFAGAMKKLPENNNYKLSLYKSGPAFTLRVLQSDSSTMSVDLVPVLEFIKPPPLSGDFNGEKWYAVPKPLTKGQNLHLYWRMSFYSFEKNMLKKHGDLKPVIRQVKKLRDKYDWKLIPSYHIETLFMHYMKDMEKQPQSRKMSRIEVFIHMLNRLKEVCENQRIDNFWDSSHNLMDVDKKQLESIIGLLGKIIKQINVDPVIMANHVLTKAELIDYEEELIAIRNSRDYGKSSDQQSAKRNVVKIEQDKSTNANVESDSSPSFVHNVLSMMGEAFAPKDTATNNVMPSNSMHNDKGTAKIIHMLKTIHGEIEAMKDSINLLSHRVGLVEDKIETLLHRPNKQDPDASELFTDVFYGRLASSSQRLGNWAN